MKLTCKYCAAGHALKDGEHWITHSVNIATARLEVVKCNAQLLRCPHCGGHAEFEKTSENDNFRILCPRCDQMYWSDAESAVEAWNRRA